MSARAGIRPEEIRAIVQRLGITTAPALSKEQLRKATCFKPQGIQANRKRG